MINQIDKFTFSSDGVPSFDGEVFNAILKLANIFDAELERSLFLAAITNHLVYFDSPIYTVLNMKGLIGLVHEVEVKNQFSSEDQTFIDDHFPYTVTMDKEIVSFRDTSVSLQSLLIEQQDNFIIKKSESLQGLDVVVGKFTDQEDWQDQVEMLLGNSHWIAQEYCPPDIILVAHECCELVEYTPVWGLFSIRNGYSGSFIRAMRTNKKDYDGVINSSKGASEFVVIEENFNKPAIAVDPISVNQGYCQSFVRMCEHYNNPNQSIDQFIDYSGDDMPAFIKAYDTVNSLPLIISKDWVDEFSAFVESYPAVVKRAIAVMFDGSEAFSFYLNESEMLYSLFFEIDMNPAELIIRYDLYSDGPVVKMLEVNVGTVIGGWQLDRLEKNCRQQISTFEQQNDTELAYRTISTGMFTCIIDSIKAIKGNNTSGVILVGTSAQRTPEWLSLEQCMVEQFEKVKPAYYDHGRLVFIHDLSQLNFDDSNQVFYQDIVIDALFTTTPEMEDQRQGHINIQLCSAYLAGNLAYPDSPFHRLFGNKLLMPLLHEFKQHPAATASEISFIDRHIPWAVRLSSLKTPQKLAKLQQILDKPEDYVLKKNASSKGDDVVIGKDTDKNLWAQRINQALDEKDWLIQQFCMPSSFYLPDNGEPMVQANLVWGVFSFNNQYSGVYGRAMPSDKGGVINQARGAFAMVVLEELTKNNEYII